MHTRLGRAQLRHQFHFSFRFRFVIPAAWRHEVDSAVHVTPLMIAARSVRRMCCCSLFASVLSAEWATPSRLCIRARLSTPWGHVGREPQIAISRADRERDRKRGERTVCRHVTIVRETAAVTPTGFETSLDLRLSVDSYALAASDLGRLAEGRVWGTSAARSGLVIMEFVGGVGV